ncbi:penicillin acylase family protein [Streptomyces mirabilis]|uniref:penicillin acylase family protein n=1 Tax=Streptomyces mirabilis TaxID=68239 RepID=UPI0036694186
MAAFAAALCLTSATVALLPAPSSAATGPGGETVAEGGHTARISRTEYGIPHILARDFDGLGYGFGYGYGYGHAIAQDNVCERADQVVTLRGERSQFFGSGGESGEGANLASDTYYTGQRRAGTVQRLLNRKAPLGPTAELRRMVAGSGAAAAGLRSSMFWRAGASAGGRCPATHQEGTDILVSNA